MKGIEVVVVSQTNGLLKLSEDCLRVKLKEGIVARLQVFGLWAHVMCRGSSAKNDNGIEGEYIRASSTQEVNYV